MPFVACILVTVYTSALLPVGVVQDLPVGNSRSRFDWACQEVVVTVEASLVGYFVSNSGAYFFEVVFGAEMVHEYVLCAVTGLGEHVGEVIVL